jgi:hypothetical protein
VRCPPAYSSITRRMFPACRGGEDDVARVPGPRPCKESRPHVPQIGHRRHHRVGGAPGDGGGRDHRDAAPSHRGQSPAAGGRARAVMPRLLIVSPPPCRHRPAPPGQRRPSRAVLAGLVPAAEGAPGRPRRKAPPGNTPAPGPRPPGTSPPKVSYPQLPLAGRLPSAHDIVAGSFGFAGQVLATRRRFADDVLKVTSPCCPEGTAAAPETRRRPA